MSTNSDSSLRAPASEQGFTLIEVLIAMLILTAGLLSLLGVIALGVTTVAASSPMLIAREKAREAVESVHTARDTGELAWSRVNNVANGGVFLAGMRDIRLPGQDGLVNTADDALAPIEEIRNPGVDGILGNIDDVIIAPDQQPVHAGDRDYDAQSGRHDGGQSELAADHGQRPLPRAGRVAHLHADDLHLQLLMIMTSTTQRRSDRGFSLIELLIAMGLTTAVMGVAMAGLSDAMRANDTVISVTGMNNGLRLAMDLMVRDLLQTGSGLGKGHVIQTPQGGTLIKRPGPPGTSFTRPAAELTIPAVIPGAGLGPSINGAATDIITILTADNNFTDVPVAAVTSNYVDVTAATNIGTGVDRVIPGQLLMVIKGAATTLVEVTDVVAASRRIKFDGSDSLNLNQNGGSIVGSMAALNAKSPTGAAAAAATRITQSPDDHLLPRHHHGAGVAAAGAPHQQRRPDDVRQQARDSGRHRHRGPAVQLRHQRRRQQSRQRRVRGGRSHDRRDVLARKRARRRRSARST